MIFAHRGASAYAPENTLAAFSLAVHQKADGIELDAKLSADGHVVVIHDQTVERTTTSLGRVANLTLAELKGMDAGSHFDVEFKGERIPTLEEVFAAIGKSVYINVELSNYGSMFDLLPDRVAELVKRHHLKDNVMFSSFNPIALRRMHGLLPEMPLALLALRGRWGGLARSWLGRFLVPYKVLQPALNDVSRHLIDWAHQAGKRVFVYTVNQAEDIRTLLSMEVDGIYTDDPLLARRVIASTRQQELKSS